MTIKEKIALLEKMMRNTEKCAEYMRADGDNESAEQTDAEAMGMQVALWLLTDEEYAEQMRDTYAND